MPFPSMKMETCPSPPPKKDLLAVSVQNINKINTDANKTVNKLDRMKLPSEYNDHNGN